MSDRKLVFYQMIFKCKTEQYYILTPRSKKLLEVLYSALTLESTVRVISWIRTVMSGTEKGDFVSSVSWARGQGTECFS